MITLNKVINAVRDQFTSQQGKDWVDNFTSPRQVANEKVYGAIGAGAGAVGGALTGLAVAEYEISKVPIQTDTEHWKTPQLDRVQVGMIPRDYYSPGDFIPFDDHRAPTERVYRDNPNTQPDGSITMNNTEKTFSGHGTPVVKWNDNSIVHHSMSDGDYSRYTTAVTHQEYDHTEHWTEQVADPTTYHSEQTSSQDCVTSYKSDGTTGEDCHTVYGTTEVANPTTYHSEDRSRDVYRTVTDGYNVSYSANVTDKIVGHFTSPSVSFDSGISVLGDMATGLGLGAALGALTGGLYGAIKDKLDGVETTDSGQPSQPSPSPSGSDSTPTSGSTEPAPIPTHPAGPVGGPTPPEAYFGDFKMHAHGNIRHAHDGGDRWHSHNSPTDTSMENNPVNTDWICFKPGNIPSGYKPEDGKVRDINGTVCFPEKGRKG